MKKINPALVLLAQENHYLKEATCCLSYLGSDPENTLSMLISLLELEKEQAWNDIILAMQHISSSSSPQLLNALQHGSPETCTGIIKVLAGFPDSKPQIIKMLHHRSARVRLAAVRALEQLGKNTSDDVAVHLKKVLNDKSRTVREAAQQAIRDLSQKGKN